MNTKIDCIHGSLAIRYRRDRKMKLTNNVDSMVREHNEFSLRYDHSTMNAFSLFSVSYSCFREDFFNKIDF